MSEVACGYVLSRYPGATNAFVVEEIQPLRATGVRVETASVRRVAPDQVLSDLAREEFERTFKIIPVGPLRLGRSHVRTFARAPRAYLTTLWRAVRLSHAGGRARLWQVFYFAEAMLLWEWMRDRGLHHIHVHHAANSADVAMLTCAYENATSPTRRWTWSLTIHGPIELLDVSRFKLRLKVADAAVVVCTSDY